MKIGLLRSLKFKMPLMVILGVIPLIIVVFSYYSHRASKNIGQESQKNMALRANMLAELVYQWDLDNKLALQNLSRQPDIISMNPTRQKPVLFQLTNTYKQLYLAMVMDRDGINVARNDSSPLKDYRDRAYFLGAIAGEPVTRQTIISRTNKRPAVCMAAPIKQERRGTIGVSAICSDLERISQELGQIKFGKTGHVFLVDKAGKIIAHPNISYISGEALQDFSDYPPVQQTLEGRNNIFFFQDKQGVNWVSYGKRLKDTGWGIVVLQQEWELFNSQTDLKNLAFSVTIITVISISILVWILANHLIKPITDLTAASTAIAEGQWDKRVAIKSSSELGILANSFNKMTDQLQNSFGKLEAKIKERTTQLNKAKEAAERANHSKDRFIANISHELRTPLNGIIGYTKILRRDLPLTAQQLEEFNIIEKSSFHLLTLINDLLDFSKNQVSKMELHPKESDLSELLNSVVGIVKNGAKAKGLELITRFDSLPATVLADEKRLQQILINLLYNAIKFTNRGKVILRVRVVNNFSTNQGFSQQRVRFEVIDTGVGVSPEEQTKIFQPFEQTGDLRSRNVGTGLGLSISKQLVELMGGKLRVKSKLGKGSNFWFEADFKIIEINTPRPQKPKIESLLGYQGKQQNILVVDDKEENRQLVVNILEPLGFKVSTAEDGEHMFEVMKETKPDLICLDLFMPKKTGFTSAKQLREMPEFKDIPLIVISATTITEEMYNYIKCDEFISKPLDEEKLLELLQQYLHIEWIYGTKEQKSKIKNVAQSNSDNRPESSILKFM